MSGRLEKENCSASASGDTTLAAEEMVIAPAILESARTGNPHTAVIDSQEACRGYTSGRISRQAAIVIRSSNAMGGNAIIWILGH